MANFFRNFFTNRVLFFDNFDLAAKNLVDMASMLQTVVTLDDPHQLQSTYEQINKKENFGDDITHKINLYLNKIVFTPLNKPDIHALAGAIDNVADAIHEASGRMYLYNIKEFSPAIKQITMILLKASIEIERAIALLRKSNKTMQLPLLCLHVKNYEHQAEQVYYHAVADLFSAEKNAIKLLKYREILYSLEASVNKCKSVTDVLSKIVISG